MSDVISQESFDELALYFNGGGHLLAPDARRIAAERARDELDLAVELAGAPAGVAREDPQSGQLGRDEDRRGVEVEHDQSARPAGHGQVPGPGGLLGPPSVDPGAVVGPGAEIATSTAVIVAAGYVAQGIERIAAPAMMKPKV